MGKNPAKKRNKINKKQNRNSIDDGDHYGKNNGRNNHNKGKHYKTYEDEYTKLKTTLETDGLEIVDMMPDGNCLFRSLSDQLFGDYGNSHDEVRSAVCDFMQDNEEDFRVFLVFEDEDDEDQDEEDARDFDHYIECMRQDGEWGGNLEVVAAARLYRYVNVVWTFGKTLLRWNLVKISTRIFFSSEYPTYPICPIHGYFDSRRSITVYSETLAAFTIDHGSKKPMGTDLLVSYHDNDHYNSVRNKLHPPTPSKVLPRASARTKRDNHDRSKEPDIDALTTCLSKSQITDPQKANIKRSAPCPCGSGLRYKKCCLAKQKQTKRTEQQRKRRDPEGEHFSEATSQDETSQDNNIFRVVAI